MSELRDALGGRDRPSLEMHLEAAIDQVRRCTCRPRLSELRDALRRYDRAKLQKYLEAVDLEGGAMATETLFTG